MTFDEFAKACTDFWTTNFQQQTFVRNSMGHAKVGNTILYPTMLVCTETQDHFVGELFGAAPSFTALKLKTRNGSIQEYFSQFPEEEAREPVIRFDDECSRIMIRYATIENDADHDKTRLRFPILNRADTFYMKRSGASSSSSMLQFEPLSGSVFLHACAILNSKGSIYRSKFITEATIISKTYQIDTLKRDMHFEYGWGQKYFMQGGIVGCRQDVTEEFILAAQAQSLYLMPHLHETTLADYFDLHSKILLTTLGARSHRYEPSLEWISAAADNEDGAINPDMLVEREDGFFDILDFKTALLDRKSLTSGERNRRTFISAVHKGIAQLANYREYFDYEANRDHAFAKYGVRVDKPRLFLVVGNFDNAEDAEITQALRPYDDDIVVVDYDSIIQLFLSGQRMLMR